MSPITELTLRQAESLGQSLGARGVALPVYVGMRNWDPFLRDTLAEMSRAGVRRAVGVIAAAHRSYSSCTQYRENVADARAALREPPLADVVVTYVNDWHLSPGVRRGQRRPRARGARESAGAAARARELVFTAHSIPVTMAARFPYEQQLRRTAAAVMRRGGCRGCAASSSFRAAAAARKIPGWSPTSATTSAIRRDAGRRGVVLCPIGFVCDHIEVLYDLDIEAAAVSRAFAAAGPRVGRQRPSGVHRDDDGGRAQGRRAVRTRTAAAGGEAMKNRLTGLVAAVLLVSGTPDLKVGPTAVACPGI